MKKKNDMMASTNMSLRQESLKTTMITREQEFCAIHRHVKIFCSPKEDALTSRLNKLTFLAIDP
jgi:hypothetical protein